MDEHRLRRLPHAGYTGFKRYFLTISTFQRRPLFHDDALATTSAMHFLIAARLEAFAVTAYCFMPDHVHALVEGQSASASLPAFVKRAKQRSGYYGKRIVGASIWQSGYYERILREDESSYSVIRYILENPVRAGLVASPCEYRSIGSSLYSVAELMAFVQRPDPHP